MRTVTPRKFLISDVKEIDRIFRKQSDLGVPSLKNVIANYTFVKSGRIIGYGVIKMYAEAVLILDDSIRKRDKAESTVHSLNLAVSTCQALGIEQLFVISNSESFTKVLKKKFGFKEASGKTLFLEFEDHGKQSS